MNKWQIISPLVALALAAVFLAIVGQIGFRRSYHRAQAGITAARQSQQTNPSTLRKAVFKLAPLPLVLPAPGFFSRVVEFSETNVSDLPKHPRPPFFAPSGVTNLARGKRVIASDNSPVSGALSMITDGDKEALDQSVVVLHEGKQWVQIDLGESHRIYAIVIWHDHRRDERPSQIFHSVVVQAAENVDFTRGVQTLFNNDNTNVLGLGRGNDAEYPETYEGVLIDGRGIQARYVRCYSKGSNRTAFNTYTEIEIWGMP